MVSVEEIGEYSPKGVAYHEAGHAVTLLKGPTKTVPLAISIVPDDEHDSLGRTTHIGVRDEMDHYLAFLMNSQYPELESFTIRELSGGVLVCLSGRAAGLKLSGKKTGLRDGACSDLKTARKYVDGMVSDPKGQVPKMRSLEAQSMELVETNWLLVVAVAENLLIEKEMDGDRFVEIVEAVEKNPKVRLVTLLKARRNMLVVESDE